MGYRITIENDDYYEERDYELQRYHRAFIGAMQDLREEEPEVYRRHQLDANYRKAFGITLAHKEEMIAKQDGKCDVCGLPFANSKDTHVDHEHHGKKRVRGIVCSGCNVHIGIVERKLNRYDAFDMEEIPLEELYHEMVETDWSEDVVLYLEFYDAVGEDADADKNFTSEFQ